MKSTILLPKNMVDELNQKIWLYLCTLCNKYKGSDLASIDPDTEKIVPLYHPRQNIWREHFQLSRAGFTPLTAIGRVTIRLLQLNRLDRIEERQLLLDAGIIEL